MKGEILTMWETEKRSKFSIDIITSVFLIIPVIVILRKLTPVQADLYFLANIFFPFIALFLSITVPGPQKSLFFPKFLLVGTLYRLTLSLAFLRLILLAGYKGGAGVGVIIVALGEISTRGDIIAGLFIFLIILFVNIIIISIYAGQMAGYCNITAPITVKDGEEEHKKFYEHMCSFAKFLRGEAIATVILMFVCTGLSFWFALKRYGMTIGEALNFYGTLSSGIFLPVMLLSFITLVAAVVVLIRSAKAADREGALKELPLSFRVLLVFSGFMFLIFTLSFVGVFPLPPLVFFIMGIIFFIPGIMIKKFREK